MDNKKNPPFSSLTGFPLVYGDELNDDDLEFDLSGADKPSNNDNVFLKPTEIYERRLKSNFQNETMGNELLDTASPIAPVSQPERPALITPAAPTPIAPAPAPTPLPSIPAPATSLTPEPPPAAPSYVPPAPVISNYTPPVYTPPPQASVPAMPNSHTPSEPNVNQEVALAFEKSQEQIANGISEFRNTQRRAQDFLDQIKAEISLEAQELKMLDHKIKQLKPQHEISVLIDNLANGTIKHDDIHHLLEAEKHIFQQRNCSMAAQRLTELSRTTFDNSQRIKETIESLNQEMAIIGIQSEKIKVLQNLKNKANAYKVMIDKKAEAEACFLEMVSFLNAQKANYMR